MATGGNNVTVWRPKTQYIGELHVPCAHSHSGFQLYILLPLLLGALEFYILLYAFVCCGGAKMHKFHIMSEGFHDTEKSWNISSSLKKIALRSHLMHELQLWHLWPIVAMKEQKKSHTRDQACPVLCMLVRLKTFSFYYIKCHKRQITAVSLNKTEENKIGVLCWYWK